MIEILIGAFLGYVIVTHFWGIVTGLLTMLLGGAAFIGALLGFAALCAAFCFGVGLLAAPLYWLATKAPARLRRILFWEW